jgi:hypothetical protein
MPLYPKLIVPLHIDLAIGVRRYLFDRSANPGALGDQGGRDRAY